MRIYITHCSWQKDDSLKGTGRTATPDVLYTSRRIKVFMDTCKDEGVSWAILSDLYGIWFPHIKHEWYDKSPYEVTEKEFQNLLKDFDKKLAKFDEIWFYRNPRYFHSLYRRLLNSSSLKQKIHLFSRKYEIV